MLNTFAVNRLSLRYNYESSISPAPFNKEAESILSKELASTGVFLSLKLQAISYEASALITRLVSNTRGVSRGPVNKLEEALGAIVGDLLTAKASRQGGYGYRSTRAGAFTGQRIGFKPFTRAVDGLKSLGYLIVSTGRRGPSHLLKGEATRFALTDKFFDLAATFGIQPSDAWAHFNYPPPPSKVKQPVICKAASNKNYSLGIKTAGKALAVDYTSTGASEAAKFIQDFNAFTAKHDLNFPHQGFVRIFNNGDKPGFDYDQGGRIYAIGGGYQAWPQTTSIRGQWSRSEITIDGFKTGEMDIGASHYTIASAALGFAIDPLNDPYDVPDLPRCIVKAWVNASLGNGKAIRRWPKRLTDDYAAEDKPAKPNRYRREIAGTTFGYSGALSKDYPIKHVLKLLEPRFPVIDALQAERKDWAWLQYTESCIIVDTIDDLMQNYNVIVLPVHDSLIYKRKDQRVVEERLRHWFAHRVGVSPRITVR